MGVFGTGLYSGDFAMDLRSAVRAVSRLPFEPERLVEIVREMESDAADNPLNEDHTVFWLVLADQFAKRGIISSKTIDRALSIIDGGDDLAMLERLGMSKPDLAKRRKMLAELRTRIENPPTPSDRRVLQKPQSYVMEIGDVLSYPTWEGSIMNPYMTGEVLKKNYPEPNDGWGAILVVDRGRAFEYLAWYRVLTRVETFAAPPTIEDVRKDSFWRLAKPGTCAASHLKRMHVENLGKISIDAGKLESEFGQLPPGISASISDISIANGMHAVPWFKGWYKGDGREVPRGVYQFPAIRGLSAIEA